MSDGYGRGPLPWMGTANPARDRRPTVSSAWSHSYAGYYWHPQLGEIRWEEPRREYYARIDLRRGWYWWPNPGEPVGPYRTAKECITMASCEKCWRDARGEPGRYRELITKRKDNPCTPEQQAGGEDAGKCEKCGRKTVHCIIGRCMNPKCEAVKQQRENHEKQS